MIPKKLTLNNFISYRQASLDFSGLHTACICGANGAGKSSLLEAITWAIWGETRVDKDDDLIYLGETNTRVDFEFLYNEQHYRIIRTKKLKGNKTLDFQICHNGEFNSLSGKNLTDTQNNIDECLKVDYKTFINSAYLKQGQADEFMSKTAAERKEILFKLLKLDDYEKIVEKAKAEAKQYKTEFDQLEGKLIYLQSQLETREDLNIQLDNLNKDLIYYQNEQNNIEQKVRDLSSLNSQREGLTQQLKSYQNLLLEINQSISQVSQDSVNIAQEIKRLEDILFQEEDIISNYQRLNDLTQEDNELRDKFKQYSRALDQRREAENQLSQELRQLEQQINQIQAELSSLDKQEKECQKTIKDRDKIIHEVEQLKYYRQQLQELDNKLQNFNVLQKEANKLNQELEIERNNLEFQLKETQAKQDKLNSKLANIPQVRKQYFDIRQQIKEIEKVKNFIIRIEEKKATQTIKKQRFIDQQNNNSAHVTKSKEKLLTLKTDNSALCPLCETPLDDNHRNHVMDNTTAEIEQLRAQNSQLDGDIHSCDREIKKLEQELTELNQKIANENNLQQQFLKLENNLGEMDEIMAEKGAIEMVIESLNNLLTMESYLPHIREELTVVESQIKALNFSQETYTLVKNQEKTYQWAEINLQDLKKAELKLLKIDEDKIKLENNLSTLNQTLKDINQNSIWQQKINQLNNDIEEINYNRDYHNDIQSELPNLQLYRDKYSQLQEAKKQLPLSTIKKDDYQQKLTNYQQNKLTQEENIKQIQQQISSSIDYSQDLAKLENQLNISKNSVNRLLQKKGAVEQSLTNLKNDQEELKEINKLIKETQKKQRIYDELSKAFHKNGIPTLILENILPQIETEANNILSRLTNNQLNIQFITQQEKANSSKKSKKNDDNYKDTLDIIISDAQGSRAYETYSGGENFRINFSIRLALSRILAQRSGTPLQLLIIDEGFGTQDDVGCNNLISALNTIASDFACILTVTHMPQFKEAFSARIEITKTDEGSQIHLST
ncbi:MAG: SMC family ATPase [Cyanobacterium sp. T60_A2020_053]|nr:SMC family ATPase [Cyanobacterium sp. T60_A2020_053]